MKSLVEPLEARIAPAGLSIADASINEGNSGTVQLQFTVSLDSPQSEEVTVQYSTADGTAISTGGSPDFAAVTNQTLTFAVGETSKTISIEVNGDNIVEANQAFTVTLSNPSGSNTLTDPTATGTINNDDTSTISIAPATDVTEGNSVTSVFTVSLSNPFEASSVTVDFKTGIAADTAKPAPGAFTDYVAQTGTLTFAAGETTKQISVAITNDTFKEDTEQFTVALSNASGATISTPTAIGKILNDSDTVVGLTLPDVKQVEGNTSTSNNVILTPTLSAKLPSALTFTLATRNGTAIAGGDFTDTTSSSVTIPANSLSTTFAVPVLGDTVFESTESFFVNLTGASGVTVVNNNSVDPVAQATARVYLYNDDLRAVASNRIQWVDVDGDLVTLSITKGSLFNVLGQLNTSVVNLSPSGTVGGQKLTLLNVNGGAFFGTNISITAAKQPGFPGESDGRVDIGAISAMVYDASELQAFGIDLGTVKIDGDLARISAGDSFSTPAIGRLDVYSLGARGTANLASGDTNLESLVLGPVGTMLVEQNIESYFHVVGSQFGTIGTLKVGGALKGNDATNSGRVSVSGRISNATIGAITGGTGLSSGVLSAQTANSATASLGNITILGDITGGAVKASAGTDDIFSGAIVAPRIDNLKVANIVGGSKERSGVVLTTGVLTRITVTGDLVGGTGKDSGIISAGTSLGTAIIDEIRGGSGEDSGVVTASTTITSLTLDRLVGGSGKGSGSVRAAVDNSGAASGSGIGDIVTLKILGQTGAADSIVGGSGVNSGRIDARGTIKTLSVIGDVQGGTASGSGGVKALTQLGTILVDGTLKGGSGDDSGTILSNGNITSVTLDRLLGGSGAGSGAVRAAIDKTGATVGSLFGNVGTVVIGKDTASGDSITGAAGANSGRIDVRGTITSVTLAGDLQGGSSGGTGVIKAGGSVGTILVKGDVKGADSGASNLGGTGAIVAGAVKALTIEGDLIAGKKTGAGTITTSGAIRVDSLDSLWIKGGVVGDSTNPVFITAAAAGTQLALKTVRIDGNVDFAEIRAGYRDSAATSADAQIGSVTIGGTVKALNLIAGAQTGADNVFGVNDQVSSGTGVINNASVISSIASVIFRNANAVQTNTGSYGIVAQLIGSITQGTARIPVLSAGAGNDTPGKELVTGSNFRALEVAV